MKMLFFASTFASAAFVALIALGSAGAARQFEARFAEGHPAAAQFILAGDRVDFTLNVDNLPGIRRAVLRVDDPSAGDPIVAYLYLGPRIDAPLSGALARAALAPDELVGPLRGQGLAALDREIRSGRARVEITTDDITLQARIR